MHAPCIPDPWLLTACVMRYWHAAEVIKQSKVDSVTRARMDDNLTFFEDAMGSCERILRTPIPLSCE